MGANIHSDCIELDGPVPPEGSVIFFCCTTDATSYPRSGTQIIVRATVGNAIRVNGSLACNIPAVCIGDFVFVDIEATARFRLAQRRKLEDDYEIQKLADIERKRCEEAGVVFVWRPS